MLAERQEWGGFADVLGLTGLARFGFGRGTFLMNSAVNILMPDFLIRLDTSRIPKMCEIQLYICTVVFQTEVMSRAGRYSMTLIETLCY